NLMNIQVNKLFLQKIASGTASKEEMELFDAWLAKLNTEEYQDFLEEYQKVCSTYFSDELPNEALWSEIEKKIEQYDNSFFSSKRKQKIFWKWSAVASLFILAIGAYVLMGLPSKTGSSETVTQKSVVNDIKPGTNKAILKLEDGSSILLDNSSEEKIVSQSGLLMTKTKDGNLVYEVKDTDISDGAITFNTIETPKGGEYQVILPDGTKVW